MKHVPTIPPGMPTMGNFLTRRIGYGLMRLQGWKFTGEIPDTRKLVAVAAPHTSNWDFIVAMPAILALGIKVSFLMKKEAFFFPFKQLFQWLGGLPTDRNKATNIASQVAEAYENKDKLWVALTPEGTRSKVDRWKTGFARIAWNAKVPILLVAFDGKNKAIVFDKLVEPREDFEAFAEELRQYYATTYQGIKPANH